MTDLARVDHAPEHAEPSALMALRLAIASLDDQRAELLAQDPSIVEHGKASTYGNWNCRCDACTAAYSDYCRLRRNKAKAQ